MNDHSSHLEDAFESMLTGEAEVVASSYTVEQTAAYFAGRVRRAVWKYRTSQELRLAEAISLESAAAFLDRIAAGELSVFSSSVELPR